MFESRHRTKDGRVFPVEINANYFEYNGRGYNLALARDISERNKAEEALRQSEGKYRTLFEESFDGLFITSPAGKILDMNKKGAMMFGYDTKEEMLSLDLERDVYASPLDRGRILSMVNETGSAEYEVAVKKKNGEQMITFCSLTAVRDGTGVITSYRGIIRDITERKKAEEALRESEAFVRKILETVDEGFIVIDRDYRILSANKAFCGSAKLSEGQVLGKYCYEVSHHIRQAVL